jgi:membrane protease subunit (stomatin/prohibitin family)
MSFGSFLRKQFIDILQWNEEGDGVLAWRYPMQDFEIQYGASLTVRESQMAVFVNEGKVADVFGPGMYKLSTQTLPVLTYLKNWDKLFESPFKSDVVFFSTRLQLGRRWGTAQPVTIRDSEFGMVRVRAYGIYAYRLVDPGMFYREISGTRDVYTVDDLEEQLRNMVVATLSSTLGSSSVPFSDMAANQALMSKNIAATLEPAFGRYGIQLDNFTVENVSLPDALQKALDTRIAVSMSGDLNKLAQYQAASAIPLAAQNEGGIAGVGAGLATGAVLAQTMAAGLGAQVGLMPNAGAIGVAGATTGTTTGTAAAPAGPTAQAPPAAAPTAEPAQRLQQLKALLEQNLITQQDYDAAKTEVLKRLAGG